MSIVVLTRPADDCGIQTTTVSITTATQFILTGATLQNATATITFGGSVIAGLSHANPTFVAQVAGDYKITIAGGCELAQVSTDDYLLGTSNIGDVTIDAVAQPQIEHVCRCDDINSDGSDIVTYFELYAQSSVGPVLTSVSLGTYSDRSGQVAYVPVNPVDCASIGSTAIESQGRIILDGATWSPPALVKSYAVYVVSVADVNTPPTFTDSFAVTSDLTQGDNFSFSFDSLSVNLSPVVTSQPGDKIQISYISLT